MAFSYDINTSKKDNRSNSCLFVTHAFANIVGLFVNTFLIAQIYSFVTSVNEYIVKVCLFDATTYLVFALTTIPFSRLVEKTNRVVIYRLGIIVRAGLVVLSIFYGSNFAQKLFLAGIVNGLANSLYYSGYNTIKQEMVSRKSMRNFSVVTECTQLFIKIAIPMLMGKLIDVSTFGQVAIYVLILCAVQVGISFGISSKKPENSNFSLKNYFKKLKQSPEIGKKMMFLYKGCFIFGFTSIIATLVNICIMMQFGSSFSLGAVSSVFSIVSMITVLCFNKFTKRGKRTIIYSINAVLPVVGTLIFVIHPTIITLIIYNLCTAICSIIYRTTFDVYRNSALKEAGLYSEITEHQAVVEILFSISRIISHSVVLMFALINSVVVFKAILCVNVLAYSAINMFLLVYEKRYFKNINDKSLETQSNDKASAVESNVEKVDNS